MHDRRAHEVRCNWHPAEALGIANVAGGGKPD